MRRYVLGIDAGNSKTIAIVAEADGHIVGWGRAGCGNIYGAGLAGALDAISTASHAALAAADVRADALSAVVLSAAGADWPEDFEFLRASIRARSLGEPIVYNDAIGGLRAGAPDGTGVAVVCGTGTAIGSRAKDGRLWHSSFWQGPQGGNFLGSVAFDAVVRAELGVAPPTALTPAVLSYFGVDTVEAALHRCTARGKPHRPMTPLAKVLLDVADEGDAAARRIVIEHGHALGDYALVAARKVGIEREPFYLVLSAASCVIGRRCCPTPLSNACASLLPMSGRCAANSNRQSAQPCSPWKRSASRSRRRSNSGCARLCCRTRCLTPERRTPAQASASSQQRLTRSERFRR